jgi:hypothetical protein
MDGRRRGREHKREGGGRECKREYSTAPSCTALIAVHERRSRRESDSKERWHGAQTRSSVDTPLPLTPAGVVRDSDGKPVGERVGKGVVVRDSDGKPVGERVGKGVAAAN